MPIHTSFIGDLLQPILHAPAWVVLTVTFLIVFAEDAIFVGFVIPGETAAILAGVAASLGHVDLAAAIAVVIAAAIIGDSVGFEVGKHLGPRMLNHRLLVKRRPLLDKALKMLENRGGLAVFLGRWTAFFRAVMPALAGMSGMKYSVFIVWNAIGGAVWGAICVVGGYLAGESYERIHKYMGVVGITVVSTVLVVGLVLWHLRQKRKERAILAQAETSVATDGQPQMPSASRD